jgi:hypothetical protein
VHAIRLNILIATFMRRFMGINSSLCQNNSSYGELQTMITVTWELSTLEMYVMAKETSHI